MAKYRNSKVTVKGITYDSKKEAHRHAELQLMERAGLISDLERQVKYVLIPSQRIDGKVVEREVSFTADFRYIKDGETIVEDVKSKITRKEPKYIIKRKMMLYFHGIRIKET